MNIIDPFVSGIAFAVGVTVGALLCRLATKQGRQAVSDEIADYHNRVEERLQKSLLVHTEMARGISRIATAVASMHEDDNPELMKSVPGDESSSRKG
jgi:uncharacterized membrane-anchored protein YhcB (DUF1043 family)